MNHTDKATVLEWMNILEQVTDKIENFFIDNQLMNAMDCSSLQTVQGFYVWDTMDAILKQMENKVKEPKKKKQKPRRPKDEEEEYASKEEIEAHKPFKFDDTKSIEEFERNIDDLTSSYRGPEPDMGF